jgi:glycosyltransferase involved in cell wall biosynthesis
VTRQHAPTTAAPESICVVGAGSHFTSGISYYTVALANALARRHRVAVIPMRRLLPARLYPGWRRVGRHEMRLRYSPEVEVFPGVDWFWLPSMLLAIVFMLRRRPRHVVFQWWTGTVLHSYLALAAAARLSGARVTIEFHEVLDPGELKLPLADAYVRAAGPLLMAMAHGFVIHSEADRATLLRRYRIGGRAVQLIHHGPYGQYEQAAGGATLREAPAACCNLLFFGLIRPYKGLEDLVRAFDALPPEAIERYWLTVVGETWEGWELPAELIAQSRYRDRITFVNRYVRDEEVGAFFAGADAVVLPYRRSSGSGALHVALSQGLPVVVSDVGGLAEAVARYEGAITVPPADPAALAAALEQAAALRGRRFEDPHSWEQTVVRYGLLFDAITGAGAPARELTA